MRLLQLSLWCCLLMFVSSCTTAKTTNTARSSTEQLLVANAVDGALDKIDFSPFQGHAVFLNDKYVECVDKNYVIASVRHRILKSGGRLVNSAEQSEVVIELRSGAVGTMSTDAFLGIPEIVLPGVVTMPEIRMAERKSQLGTAKIGIVAYDPQTGQALGTGGTTLAQAEDNNWFVAGAGPFRSGSLRKELTQQTSGKAATRHTTVSHTVAFTPPQQLDEQVAEQAQPLDEVSPASGEKTNRTEWIAPSP